MFNCETCGYPSPDGTRFCRQCGSALPGTDPLESQTRNYGSRGAAVAAAESAPLPPSIGDAVQGNTARYQQAPVPVVPGVYAQPSRIPPAPNTSSIKKKRRFLKWGALLLALLISGGIGAGINEVSNDGKVYLSQEDQQRLDRMRTEDQIRRTMTGAITESQEQIREELERRREAIERAKEDAERAKERGDAPSLDEKPLDLASYEYPGASAGEYIRIPGREVLTQRTPENFDAISRFYQDKMGKPFVQSNDRGRRQVIFQTVSAPSVTVFVRETPDRSRQPEIVVLRSPFRFPITLQDQERLKAEQAPKVGPPEPPKPKTVP